MVKLCLEPPVYKVADLLYSPTSAVIENQGEKIRLRAREANLFHELIKTFPEVLSRTAIEQTLWKDSYATNATINQTVKALRFSLQDVDRTLIRTIPKQGYVLAVAPQIQQDNQAPENLICKVSPELSTEPVEKSPIDMNIGGTSDEMQQTAPKKNLVHSIAAILTAGIFTFVLTASGVLISPPQRISHQHGQHWILFSPEEQELDALPIGPNETTKYVTKHESFYKICSEIEGVLECKHVEF